jgi:hypothetical protein
MLHFAGHYSAWRDKLGLRPDPLGLAMPLLEFMADGDWAKLSILKQVVNFDNWVSRRGANSPLTDYAVGLQ